MLKNFLWIKTTQKADHIITISEFSKKEIIRDMKISASKISVIPLGVDDFYFKRVAKNSIQEILKKFQLPKKYFLFVGAIQPRKNIIFMIKAHEKLCYKFKISIPLVLIANDVFHHEEITNEILIAEEKGYVRWLKYVNDEDKRAILQNAQALLLPSLYEGFGLTLLEAFASRVPAITSNLASMPEVSEDAATLINPYLINDLVTAMENIYRNKKLRARLIKKGYAKAKTLTWKKTALKTLSVYKKVLKKYNARPTLL
jgi:alpha-1,3-rhamnosyl/mannosyltransferase